MTLVRSELCPHDPTRLQKGNSTRDVRGIRDKDLEKRLIDSVESIKRDTFN
jgi:hypothetical protein